MPFLPQLSRLSNAVGNGREAGEGHTRMGHRWVPVGGELEGEQELLPGEKDGHSRHPHSTCKDPQVERARAGAGGGRMALTVCRAPS